MLSILLLVAVSLVVVAARPDVSLRVATVGPSQGHSTVVIPAHAVEVAPGVFSLGTAVDNGRVVEGYAFLRFKDRPAKPGTECGNGVCEPGENAKKCPADCSGGTTKSSCFSHLSKGAKWKSVEPYVVNPSNGKGLSASFVTSNLAGDIDKWEDAAGLDILGGGSSTNDILVADTVSPGGQNEVYFADVGSSGAIAITIFWGIFRGPPTGRELVEWDQVYDDVDFNWSDSGSPDAMDFENIATHELGHSFGMDDLDRDECSEETMFGFASNGETKKQSLESGDIQGIQALYG